MRERILITGPGGRVGTHLVPLLREHFALRLFDAKPFEAGPVASRPEFQQELSRSARHSTSDDEVIVGDIRDFDALRAACAGVRAMLHLAAIPDEDDFHSKLLPINVTGVYNAFEAARQSGVKKVLFASTGQTVLNYAKGEWVTPEMPVRPSTVYACTKIFGEALARHYSDIHGLSMICIRLCYFRGYDDPLLRIPNHLVQREWCSPRDLAQLVVKSIRADIPFGIFFGVSNNTGRFWDVSNAKELVGYEPEDDAATFLEEGRGQA